MADIIGAFQQGNLTDNKAKYAPGMFPTLGLNVSCEYGRQPAGTTPEGVNVRAFEPDTNRERGGSRSGLSKLIDEVVYEADGEVQCLAIIVTAGTANLLAGVTPPVEFQPFYLLDPSTGSRNPDRVVPIGGSGVMPAYDVTNNPDDGQDEDQLHVGTTLMSGQVNLVVNGINVTATTNSGVAPPVGTKVTCIPVSPPGTYKYDPPLFT